MCSSDLPVITKIYALLNIIKQFPNQSFLTTPIIYELAQCLSISKLIKFGDIGPNSSFLYDTVQVRITNSLSFNLSRTNYLKIKNFVETFLVKLVQQRISKNKKTFLLVEFNPVKYSKLLMSAKSKQNLLLFNRRRPSIWNLSSFGIIKKSRCSVFKYSDIVDENFNFSVMEHTMSFDKKLDSLFQNNNALLTEFFSIQGHSIWSVIQRILTSLWKKRIVEAITEIKIAKIVLEKYKPNAVLVWSENGLNEQIVIHFAKKMGLSVILIQHGLYDDGKAAIEFNKFAGVIPINSDIIACWGESLQNSLKEWGIPQSKIRVIGSSLYEDAFKNKSKFRHENQKFILFATSAPTNYISSDLTVQTREDYFASIKKICEITLKLNKKLVIKLHPAQEEIDITDFVKNIDPKIKVIKKGDIMDLIPFCEIFISTELSTTLLEAQIFEKPTISLSVRNYKFGTPKIFDSKSCLVANLDNIESIMTNLLADKTLQKNQIDISNCFVSYYLSNQNTASEKLIEFLESV